MKHKTKEEIKDTRQKIALAIIKNHILKGNTQRVNELAEINGITIEQIEKLSKGETVNGINIKV